jgi:anthranilate synthase/aminodeoxychorismate synthase-like glutamine amidotransferase
MRRFWMKILVIDNYDSFTYNLVQLIGKFSPDITVIRNDAAKLDEIYNLQVDKIVISPGPGRPENSNLSLEVVKEMGDKIPILGVCLGHQGIGVSFGCKVVHAPVLMHGKTSKINHDGKLIYKNIPQNFVAGRYHSLVLDKDTLPSDLIITARTKEGTIMGIRHTQYPIEGIQFHPESILTQEGESIIKNWIAL